MKLYNIEKYSPCLEALAWYKTQPDSRTAWNNCPRGDWMLWIAQKMGVDERLLTLAKGYCAKTVMHLMKDKRSRKAVDVAIEYGQGKVTKKELIYYAAAAYAADAVDAAKKTNRIKTADICREHLTDAVFSIIDGK